MISFDKKLIKGSIILLIIFNLYALLNFIFQSSMARMLSIEDYGILAELFYFPYFLNIFSEAIQTIIAKYTTSNNSIEKSKNIFRRAFRRISKPTFCIFIVYMILAIPLSFILDISYGLFAINSIFIFNSFFLPINRGIMQGMKRFFSLGFNLLVEASFKLGLAILFVFIGWRVYGGILGATLGGAISLASSFLFLKEMNSAKERTAKTPDIYGYSTPVFLVTFAILVFYTADLFIVQLLFSKEIAGNYAIASILSKAVFWGTQPISKAMFPLSAENTAKKNRKTNNNTFYNSFALLIFGILACLSLFYFFPGQIISLFSGKDIALSASLLFILWISTSFLSIANLILLFKISQGKTKGALSFFLVLVLSIALLIYFSHTIYEFSYAFLTASALFLWSSIFFLR